MIKHINRTYADGIKEERLKLKTPDGRLLEASYLSKQSDLEAAPNKTVILFSGSHRSYEFYTVPMANAYLEKGYHVLCFNYGGFGASEGQPSQKSIELDAETVYQYLRDVKEVKDSDLVVHGFSLGSYPATYLSCHYPISKLIINRGFIKISTVAEDIAKSKLGKIVGKIVKLLTNYIGSFNNEKLIRQVKGKVLIARGTKDPTMRPNDYEALIEAFGQGQQLSKEELKSQGRLVALEVEVGHIHTAENLWFGIFKSDQDPSKRAFNQFIMS